MRKLPLLAGPLLLLTAAATAADGFDYARLLEPASKVQGTWTGKFVAAPGEGEVVGIAVSADWWEGPGDLRVADEKRAPMEGIVFEVRRGEGAWVPLPPAARGLDLRARVEAPADAKDLVGGSAAGEWSVRQARGSEYPRRVRVEFVCRGDPLLITDLRIASLSLPDLDPRALPGRVHFPDRQENRTLKPGAAISAVVVVENCGARRTKEVDLDLVVVPFGERQGGKRIAFVQVPKIAAGKTVELALSGNLPDDFKESGIHEILAVVNPRLTLPEVEPLNNYAGRGFRLEMPSTAMPEDLRDR